MGDCEEEGNEKGRWTGIGRVLRYISVSATLSLEAISDHLIKKTSSRSSNIVVKMMFS